MSLGFVLFMPVIGFVHFFMTVGENDETDELKKEVEARREEEQE